MQKVCFLILGICYVCFANAQTHPIDILHQSIDKINALKSVSYEVKTVQKNPFSNNDTSVVKAKAVLAFNNGGFLKAMNEKTNINDGQTQIRNAFSNDTLYSINLSDSLYSFDYKKPENVSNSLSSFIDLVKYVLTKSSKIIPRPDTTIDHNTCYNFFIKSYDTVENNNHNYTYQTLLINKTTLMPVSTKEVGVGSMEKDGHALGRLNIYTEVHFSNFRLNEKITKAVFQFNKTGFNLYNNKMLADGVIAPELQVKNLSNQKVSPSDFNKKLLLVEFGSTTCAANPLANPMLNRLNKKYKSKDFVIISVYSEESSNQVEKYVKSNHLEFSVYLGNNKLKRDFKTMGTPGFYLIDRNGKVIKSSNGYSDDLEKDLSKEIENRIQK